MEDKNTSSNDVENAKRVVWALGGQYSADKAHAYISESDYEQGHCLCGRKVNPYLKLENWDLNNDTVAEHTCKGCRERLKLLNFVSSLKIGKR